MDKMKLKMSSGTLSGLEDQVVTHKQGLLIYIQFVPFATLHVSFQAFQGCTKNRREDYHFSCLWPLLKRCTQVKITERHRSGQLFESFFFFLLLCSTELNGLHVVSKRFLLCKFALSERLFVNHQHVYERSTRGRTCDLFLPVTFFFQASKPG